MSAPCFISLVLFRWARGFLLGGRQSQSMWQLYSQTHTLPYVHEFLACLSSYLWIIGLTKESYNASVVNKSNKNSFKLSKHPYSGVGLLALSVSCLQKASSSSLCAEAASQLASLLLLPPARVWKWFDILVNFIGSEHPFADLIIFRDLKVRVIHSSAKPSPVRHWNEEGCFPVVCISRKNGGRVLVRPIFIRERGFRGPRS